MLKILQACKNLMTDTTDCTSHTHPGPTTTTATMQPVARQFPQTFTQRPNKETETPKHKTLNSALVPTNEVLSITWKLSEDHTPSHT